MANSFQYVNEELWLTVAGEELAFVYLAQCEIAVDEDDGSAACRNIFVADASGHLVHLADCGLRELIVAEVERRFNAGLIDPPEHVRMPSNRSEAA